MNKLILPIILCIICSLVLVRPITASPAALIQNYGNHLDTSGFYHLTYSTQTSPPVIPADENLIEWANYAMDWFDYTYSSSPIRATRDDVFKMVAIYTFVHAYVTYQLDHNYAQSPFETLRLRTGDCKDYATLTASLSESVGLDASIDLVYASSNMTNENSAPNHAMSLIYFNAQENELSNALSHLQIIYQISSYRFTFYKEPISIIVRSSDGFTYANKYSTGIWVTLENWSELKNYYIINYSNDYLSNFQIVRDLMAHPYVAVYFTWSFKGNLNAFAVDVQLVNRGVITARNVIVWIGFDAGNEGVYVQGQYTSPAFQLGYDETKPIDLQIEPPRGVHTRMLVWVYGDNFDVLKSESSWFNT